MCGVYLPPQWCCHVRLRRGTHWAIVINWLYCYVSLSGVLSSDAAAAGSPPPPPARPRSRPLQGTRPQYLMSYLTSSVECSEITAACGPQLYYTKMMALVTVRCSPAGRTGRAAVSTWAPELRTGGMLSRTASAAAADSSSPETRNKSSLICVVYVLKQSFLETQSLYAKLSH